MPAGSETSVKPPVTSRSRLLLNREITGTDLLRSLGLLLGTQSNIRAVSGPQTERDHWNATARVGLLGAGGDQEEFRDPGEKRLRNCWTSGDARGKTP